MTITNEFMEAVLEELMQRWDISDVSQRRFSRSWGLDETVFSTLKGKYDRNEKGYSTLLSNTKWLGLGRALGVYVRHRKWKTVETKVFKAIREEVLFCKEESRSMLHVADADVGKTEAAKALAAKLPGVYYIDCSRCKDRGTFLKLLAKTVGAEYKHQNLAEVFDSLVYALLHNDRPLVILDEAGDLTDKAFLEIKALWNATEHYCGWYMMGADGLRAKMERGYSNKRLGYAEVLRRFGSKFNTVVPADSKKKQEWCRELITQVLEANMTADEMKYLDRIVTQCMANHGKERMGLLTRAESLLYLYKRADEQKEAERAQKEAKEARKIEMKPAN